MKKLLIIVAIAIIAVVAIAKLFVHKGDASSSDFWERTVPIENIISSPQEYADRQIEIKGVVSEPFGLFNQCWFKVTDDTGTITVHGKDYMAPAEGKKVRLKGCVKLRFRVGNYHIMVFEIASI